MTMAARVEKATSDLLLGPDWTMNMTICDSINSNPGLTKDVAKAVRKRLQNKSPRVQSLALTLLETMIKNCGDYVHFQVADRDILQEMVKIVKKRTDKQVRDKVLVLLDSWQEAFGGRGGKYPQYYWAYTELKSSGLQFPQRSPDSTLIFTPSVAIPAKPQVGYGMPSGSTLRLDDAMALEMSNLSLSDLDSFQSVMELLSDMLRAVRQDDPEAVKDELITDLVSQCRSNQTKLMEFLNSTGDEKLLARGLTLNDRSQLVLEKHDAIASASPLPAIAAGEALPGPGTPAIPAPAPAVTKQYDDEEEEDDDFAQLARRNSKNKAATQSSSAGSNGQLASPNHSDDTYTPSESSSSAGCNALALTDPPAPAKVPTGEQDIIDLLSITISDPPPPSPPTHTPPYDPFQSNSPPSPNGPTQHHPYMANQQQPYMGNQHHLYMGNHGYSPFDSYVAPWAQTPPHFQPQVFQVPTSFPLPPWEAPSSTASYNAYSSVSYQYPSSAPYVRMQQCSVPATAAETQVNMNHRQAENGGSPKPYIPPYRLFEDLVDLRSTDKGVAGSPGQSMISGRK